MAIDRHIPTSASPDPVTGDDFMDLTQEELTGLWNYASVPLTITGGTADDIAGTLSPPLTDGWQDGMRITFVAGADNTGAMTVTADGEPAVDLVDGNGSAVGAGRVLNGNVYEAIYIASLSELRLLGAAMPSSFTADYQVFNSSGTWSKPAGLSDNALVIVECIGGGGGGGSSGTSGGGGGGGYSCKTFRGADLSASETVTIGAGGAVNTAGGVTSFGSLLSAFGGGGGSTSGGGGGGGGSGAAGNNGASSVGGNGGSPSGGLGGAAGVSGGSGTGGGGGGGRSDGADGGLGGDGYFGGGGGGGDGKFSGGAGGGGGKSCFGGGGGGGSGSPGGSGGVSIHAGNGGASGVAGSAPGGGGGRNAVGAAGRCIVHVIG